MLQFCYFPIQTVKDMNGKSRYLSSKEIKDLKEEIAVRLSSLEYEYKEDREDIYSSNQGLRRRR